MLKFLILLFGIVTAQNASEYKPGEVLKLTQQLFENLIVPKKKTSVIDNNRWIIFFASDTCGYVCMKAYTEWMHLASMASISKNDDSNYMVGYINCHDDLARPICLRLNVI